MLRDPQLILKNALIHQSTSIVNQPVSEQIIHFNDQALVNTHWVRNQ